MKIYEKLEHFFESMRKNIFSLQRKSFEKAIIMINFPSLHDTRQIIFH